MKIVREIEAIESPEVARFYIWVDKGADCWEWQGAVTPGGYGRTSIGGQGELMAHRLAWVIEHGSIDASRVVDHACHNKLCVNPAHLRLATQKQNSEHVKPVRASSGYRGVHARGDKFVVTVGHNRKNHYGGLFSSAEAANEAAIALRNRLFTHNLLDRTPA